jgi:hypothetical protein
MIQHCLAFIRRCIKHAHFVQSLPAFVAFLKGFIELLIKTAVYKTTPVKDFSGSPPAQLADYFQLMKSNSQYQIIVSNYSQE